jgi:hypothetical protein
MDAVWDLVAHAEGWPAWAPMLRNASLEREGAPERDGKGAIRVFGTAGVNSREEVIAFERPRRFGYRMLSGLPVVGYQANVTLEPDADGTRITWASSWESSKRPHLFWKLFLRQTVWAYARALARQAAREHHRSASD